MHTYFVGEFRMTEFRGSSSGTVVYTDLLASMALDPTNTYLKKAGYGWSEKSYLELRGPGSSADGDAVMLGNSDPGWANSADCPSMITTSGNSLTMRITSASSVSVASQCASSQISQNGSQIAGTVTFWEHSYNDGVLVSQGQGSYTLRGTYVK